MWFVQKHTHTQKKTTFVNVVFYVFAWQLLRRSKSEINANSTNVNSSIRSVSFSGDWLQDGGNEDDKEEMTAITILRWIGLSRFICAIKCWTKPQYLGDYNRLRMFDIFYETIPSILLCYSTFFCFNFCLFLPFFCFVFLCFIGCFFLQKVYFL